MGGGGQNNKAFGFDDDFVNGGKNGARAAGFDDPDFKFNFDEFQYQEKPQKMTESTL